jgi:phosphoenolpyruvate carboxylase
MLFTPTSLEVKASTKDGSVKDYHWFSSAIEKLLDGIQQLSRPDKVDRPVDSRPQTANELFSQLTGLISDHQKEISESVSLELLDVFRACTPFLHHQDLDSRVVIADRFLAESTLREFHETIANLQQSILSIEPNRIEEFADICIRINHLFNIIGEVERLNRTQGATFFDDFYHSFLEKGFQLQQIDALEIIWTGTAHPNRFVTLSLEKSIGELVDTFVGAKELPHNRIEELLCTILKGQLIPDTAPRRVDEASYISRTFAESAVEGLKKLFRQDLAARRNVMGIDAPPPSYRVELHLWPTFDWDGQRSPNSEETLDSIKRNRQLACNILGHELSSFIARAPQHILVSTEQGQHSLESLLARYLNRIRAIERNESHDDPMTYDRLLSGLDATIVALQNHEDNKHYQSFIDDLMEFRFIASSIGLHLCSGEHRQNSDTNEKVLSQVQNFFGCSGYETKSETEKLKILSTLLSDPELLEEAGKKIQESMKTLPQDAKDHFSVLNVLKMELIKNPHTCDRSIISLTTESSDILEAELLLRLAGINSGNPNAPKKGDVRLEIVPLFERPEDKVRSAAIFDNAINHSQSLLSLVKSFKRLSAMCGYSDGQMRGGPGDRELSREMEEQLFNLATDRGLKLRIQHGIGPGVGRGGGLNGDQSMLTPEAVQSKYIHFTIQGTAIGKLLRVAVAVFRQGATALKNYAEGLARFSSVQIADKQFYEDSKKIRKDAYEQARNLYSDFTGRGKITTINNTDVPDEDIFFASLNLIFPVSDLDGLKQVSRPLFRFEQKGDQSFFNGLQNEPEIWAPYESFRAVPNSQISDGSRLSFLSLYSWGHIMDQIREQKGDEFLKELYVKDRAFQADVNGALLALQVAHIPFSLALYRAQYESKKGVPLVDRLLTSFDLIEKDYLSLLDAIDVLEPVIIPRVKSTLTEIRKMRGLKDPTAFVFQVIRSSVTARRHQAYLEGDKTAIDRYSQLGKYITLVIGTSLDTGS